MIDLIEFLDFLIKKKCINKTQRFLLSMLFFWLLKITLAALFPQ